jgi:two-component system chemotaxis response regulator CheB
MSSSSNNPGPGQAGGSPRSAGAGAAPIRVLIVDDSAFMRQALRGILSADPEIQVLDAARNGQEGIDKAKTLKPDVVTLDIEMPVMDGLTALQKIRAACTPAPAVLMCSTLTKAGSRETLKALRLGAADFIEKHPDALGSRDQAARDQLLAKIKAIGHGARSRSTLLASPSPPRPSRPATPPTVGGLDCIVIGSSTGGPPVLETLVAGLTPGANCPPVVIAQHMPAMFTASLAERLDELGGVRVVHAEDGMRLQPGTVYVSPGGKQTQIAGRAGGATLTVGDEPANMLYRPCVNVLFWSAARVFGRKLLGVICTGMGDDGMLGAKELVACGGTVWAQEGSTCVVYGMPRAVVQPGIASEAMSPEELAAQLGVLTSRSASKAA